MSAFKYCVFVYIHGSWFVFLFLFPGSSGRGAGYSFGEAFHHYVSSGAVAGMIALFFSSSFLLVSFRNHHVSGDACLLAAFQAEHSSLRRWAVLVEIMVR